MKTQIQSYNHILKKVKIIYKIYQLNKRETTKGRKLAIPIPEIIALAIFKQMNGIPTKKRIYKVFEPPCSYKTLVVNINRFSSTASMILILILKKNQRNSHFIKYTDATDIPVCSNRKARDHQTMFGLAHWGKTGKGWFYGLKLHLTADFKRNVLSIKFTSGNVDDRRVFEKLNQDLNGIFVCDAGYISQELGKRFSYSKRIILAIPKTNMKKLATDWQIILLKTRMKVEVNFRLLKSFYGLITSLPRSVNGYFANYIYSLLAYQLD